MPWKLFVVEPSGWCRRSFRRYAMGTTCGSSKIGCHDAEVVVDPRLPEVDFPPAGILLGEAARADPRWPRTCACGYVFLPEDSWQINTDRLYQASPEGERWQIRDLPVGAMWNASWLAEDAESRARYAGPDGKAWCVMMPNRVEWIVYGPSSNGQKWEVAGTPPGITVSPSIGINMNLQGAVAYHGFIKGGVITEDCDGRTFEGVPRTA